MARQFFLSIYFKRPIYSTDKFDARHPFGLLSMCGKSAVKREIITAIFNACNGSNGRYKTDEVPTNKPPPLSPPHLHPHFCYLRKAMPRPSLTPPVHLNLSAVSPAWTAVSELTCSTLTRPIWSSGRTGLMRRPSRSRVGVTS